jgi:hypothetical protein
VLIFRPRNPISNQPGAVATPTSAPASPPAKIFAANASLAFGIGLGGIIAAHGFPVDVPSPPPDVFAFVETPPATLTGRTINAIGKVPAGSTIPRVIIPVYAASTWPPVESLPGTATRAIGNVSTVSRANPAKIASAEPPRPFPGAVIEAIGGVVSPSTTPRAVVPVRASAEPPRPYPGGVVEAIGGVPSGSRIPHVTVPVFARSELPTAPFPGSGKACRGGVISVGTTPKVVPVVIASTEPPRPFPGSVLDRRGGTDSTVREWNPPASIFLQEPPPPFPGNVIADIGGIIPPVQTTNAVRSVFASQEPAPAFPGRAIRANGNVPAVDTVVPPPLALVAYQWQPFFEGSSTIAGSRDVLPVGPIPPAIVRPETWRDRERNASVFGKPSLPLPVRPAPVPGIFGQAPSPEWWRGGFSASRGGIYTPEVIPVATDAVAVRGPAGTRVARGPGGSRSVSGPTGSRIIR